MITSSVSTFRGEKLLSHECRDPQRREYLFFASLPGYYCQPLTNIYLMIKGYFSQSLVTLETKYDYVDCLSILERKVGSDEAKRFSAGLEILGVCEAPRPTH